MCIRDRAEYEADFSGSEEVRSGIKAGSVFYYLQRQDDVSYEAGGGLYLSLIHI